MSKTYRMLTILWNDTKRIFSGLFALLSYVYVREEISLSLSLFSTDSQNSQIGKTSVFELTLANNSREDLRARVLFDFYRKDNPIHTDGHLAYFEKKVFVKNRASQKIVMHYNWQEDARFEIDGVISAPDSTWRGSGEVSGKYRVFAVLLDETGKTVETLTIIQSIIP
jgi:hypothetical protein